jgi:3-methyladenine DNA glycosylase AlkD
MDACARRESESPESIGRLSPSRSAHSRSALPTAQARPRAAEIVSRLESQASSKNVEGMARFGIRPKSRILGISIWELRRIAKELGKDHALAQELWRSGIHEARILASFIDDPRLVTEQQLDRWVEDFDTWDITDQVVELVAKTPFASRKVREWAGRDEEFVKRAAFALIAELSLKSVKLANSEYERFFPLIKRAATDDRNFVKKAVNWALRQVGKRNEVLRKSAIRTAEEIAELDSRSARWIASDALRELRRTPNAAPPSAAVAKARQRSAPAATSV